MEQQHTGTGSNDAEATTWLSEDEQRTWRAYLHATTLLEDHLDRQLQRDAKMPHIYFGLLVQLSEAPKRRLRNDFASCWCGRSPT